MALKDFPSGGFFLNINPSVTCYLKIIFETNTNPKENNLLLEPPVDCEQLN